MAKLVTLTIDGVHVEVPQGTLIVDAAKKVGIDIPVFCYHPKMEPVGMCRMCLVEVGRPVTDRATGEPVLDDDGQPKIQFGSKLETACTTPVSEGMVVLGASQAAKDGRQHILEFLLTSHPLDCPICDKGGECPLQNLTMGWGPSQSRFAFDEKMHLAKHVPLGDLIYLDRERCIQCARCVRFQNEVAGDPVIGFFHRGRSLEIVTFTEPGFDSYWSGNTTDICPVGALTTADFRFRARSWELSAAASLCTHCPVGCNLTLNLRREAVSGGGIAIKRIMPRQNEEVNEIWICDKGRFGYHFAGGNDERLKQPLVRQEGELCAASWEEALKMVCERFRQAGEGLFTLVGGRLTNEDLFNLNQLTDSLGGEVALYSHMGGGELTTQVGFAPGTDFAKMDAESAILVVGCDLEEEAPLWWMRVKQAAERGAKLIVLNTRNTKLDRAATHMFRYPFGAASAAVLAMLNAISAKRPGLPASVQNLTREPLLDEAAKVFAEAQNAVILYGSDGMGLVETQSLAQACANLLIATDHTGRSNNGLLGVWPRANDQGAWEMGLHPRVDLASAIDAARVLYIAGADPMGDDPSFQAAFGGEKFVVVQDLFLTQTARLADVVLPALSWTEREGSYTSGERRVQRFYKALPTTTSLAQRIDSPGSSRSPLLTTSGSTLNGAQADFVIAALIAQGLQRSSSISSSSAGEVFTHIGKHVPTYAGLTYQKLSEVRSQWPIVSRGDLFYGGTSYENSQGMGVQLSLSGSTPALVWPHVAEFKLPKLGMMAFPVTRLLDQGITLSHSDLLQARIGEPFVVLNAVDAGRLKVQDGDVVQLTFANHKGGVVLQAQIDESLPERVVLVPRSFGVPVNEPVSVEVKRDT